MTPENKVKTKLKELLDAYSIFHWPAAASPYGVAGVPDRFAIVRGRCIGLEVKAPGKKPTPLQLEFGRRMQRSGALWFLIDGDEALSHLKQELEAML
jgi:hypothetical protein